MMKHWIPIAGAAASLLALAPPGQAGPYTFTKIAETNGVFDVFCGTPVYCNPNNPTLPSINDEGDVAFTARLDAAAGGAAGVFVGSGGPFATIATTDGSFDDFLTYEHAINNDREVAFVADLDVGGRGVYKGSGGPLTTIADGFPIVGTRASINNSGVVAFVGRPDDADDYWDVLIGSGGALATIRQGNGFYERSYFPRINDSGVVAFDGDYCCDGTAVGRRVYLGDGTDTNGDGRPDPDIIVDSATSSFFPVLMVPDINNHGDAVFQAHYELGGEGIFKGLGHLSLVDTFGLFNDVDSPNYNDNGTVAFVGTLDAGGGQAIYAGPLPAVDKVIGVGDELFGQAVTDLRFGWGLNNEGQIAFYALLADGNRVIARADPPNVAAGMSTASPVSLSQTVDVPSDPLSLTFDHKFETTTGFLTVLLGGIVHGSITAPVIPQTDFAQASFPVDGSLLGQTDVDLEFLMDGPVGSTVLIDNVDFPGLFNANFQAGNLSGWEIAASPGGSVDPGIPGADPAGRVPNGDEASGLPLVAGKSGDQIVLSWDLSCTMADGDYEIYEGEIGSFPSHAARFCTTDGATTKTFNPEPGDRYYLVVPRNGLQEGSYGSDSSGAQRPQSAGPCLIREVDTCW